MLRKNVRLRKEFLYKKEQERQQDKQTSSKRSEQLKSAQAKLDSASVAKKRQDDEYFQEEYIDPQILLTTCRDPSSRLLKFFKEIGLTLPNCVRMNRGAYKLKDIVDMCNKRGFSDLIFLHEHQGKPDGLVISHLPNGPTLYMGLGNTVLRHDVESKSENISQATPHLIFHNFGGKVGERLMRILQNLFPIANEDSKRVISFVCNEVNSLNYQQYTFIIISINLIYLGI